MSMFTGSQHKGAMRVRRDKKREEARARNAEADARLRTCGHVHGRTGLSCETA